MVAAGTIIASATVGAMASTVNPFSIGVASEFAGVGIGGRNRSAAGSDGSSSPRSRSRTSSGTRSAPRRSRRARWWASRPRTGRRRRRSSPSAGLTLTGRQKLVLGITAFSFALLVFSVVPWDSILHLEEHVDPYTHQTDSSTTPGGTSAGGSPSSPRSSWWPPSSSVLSLATARRRSPGNIAQGFRDFIGAGVAVVARPRRDGDPEQHADDRHDPPAGWRTLSAARTRPCSPGS